MAVPLSAASFPTASTINIVNMIVQHDRLSTLYSYRVRISSLVSFHSKKDDGSDGCFRQPWNVDFQQK